MSDSRAWTRFGNLVESAWVPPPRDPTPGEDARRIVRHGMADYLAWLGEPVGPKPGEQVHTIYLVPSLTAELLDTRMTFESGGGPYRDQVSIWYETRLALDVPNPRRHKVILTDI